MNRRHRGMAVTAVALLALGLGGCGSDQPEQVATTEPPIITAPPTAIPPAAPTPVATISDGMLLPPEDMTGWNGNITWQVGTAQDADWAISRLMPAPSDLGVTNTLTRGYTTSTDAPMGEVMRGIQQVWLFPDPTTALAAFAMVEDALIGPDWDTRRDYWSTPFHNRMQGLVSWSRNTACLAEDLDFCTGELGLGRYEFAGLVRVDNVISMVGFTANMPDANWCDPSLFESERKTCAMQDPQLPSLRAAMERLV